VLGELTIGLMVGAFTPANFQDLALYDGEKWTNDEAAGWDGDRWEMWVRGQSAVVLLSTVWDSPRDAEEFAAALQPDAGLVWKRAGERVAILAGDAGSKEGAILDRLLKATCTSGLEP
jgi:hypothetical protein